jgi:predicted HTH transcriptional regulator
MKPNKNVDVSETVVRKVIRFVNVNGYITNRQCRELLGLGYDQATALFNKMVQSGDLVREGKTSSVKYVLPPK